MAEDDARGPGQAVKRRRLITEAERREALSQLVLRDSKLTASEVVLLRQVFPTIVTTQHRRVLNLSHAAAAAMLGLPLGTVKSRHAAAKRELHELLLKYLPESQRHA